MPDEQTSDADRNAAILRRTLSAVSWLYAVWTAMVGLATFGATTKGPYDAQLLLLHAVLLGGAGALLWKPRPAALVAALLAIAGSVFFVVLDLTRHTPEAAVVDGLYAVVAAALLVKSRR